MENIMSAMIFRKALILALCFVSAPLFARDEPLKFNWGAPTADYAVLYVAIEQDLFKEVGLAPEFYWFSTGAPLLAGLKSGSIDVVSTGLATVFALGQNIPLTFIGWEMDTASGAGLVVGPESSLVD